MSLSDVFLFPAGAALLAVLPIAWWIERAMARRRARAVAAELGARAPKLVRGGAPHRERFARGAAWCGALLAITAGTQPTFGPPESAAHPRGSDLVFCLDLSRSMLAGDVAPTRLAAAQAAIARLCGEAAGDRFALVAFAGEARLRSPLTTDLASFAELVSTTHPTDLARGGTDLAAALALAEQALSSARGEASAVVLLSDGEDLEGRGLAAARALAERGIPVHALGYGTERGAKIALGEGAEMHFLHDEQGRDVVTRLDPRSLAAIAEATGGRYATAAEDSLLEIYRREIAPRASTAFEERTRDERAQRYRMALLPAVLIGILLLARPARSRRP